ncbi:MAG TPA: FkbM family methyltransferase [Acidobacteriaceae bacterium]|nr:FkbM family methyltransferase [Acidobacteriaceae bacterium]
MIQNLIRKEYGRLPRNMKASFIIDAGANVGDTSLYFLHRFRNCRIIALEPHPVFFQIAARNLGPYGNATLLRKGLWDCAATLEISDDATGSSVCSGNAAAATIETTDVATILQQYGSDHIDILKMDIEGAERNVILHNSDSWLPRTSMIIVELHGTQIREECTSYLKKKGFNFWRYRSLHYFLNQAIRDPAWD